MNTGDIRKLIVWLSDEMFEPDPAPRASSIIIDRLPWLEVRSQGFVGTARSDSNRNAYLKKQLSSSTFVKELGFNKGELYFSNGY